MIELILQAERALSVGQLDQAERLYRQAAELDPRNAIAVVGLARVTLERSDERTALALAAQALAIDPENASARRMVDRLEEIMRFRGDEPAAPPATVEAPAAPRAAVAPPAAPADQPPPEPSHPRRSLLDRFLRRG